MLVLLGASGAAAQSKPGQPLAPPASRPASPAGGSEGAPATAPAQPLSPAMKEAFGLLQLRRYDDAIEAFKKAFRREAPTARTCLGLAQAYAGVRAHKNALQTCDKVLELPAASARDKAAAHNLKGVALFSRAAEVRPPDARDLEAAAQEFRSTLDLDPTFVMARFNLGVVLLKKGNDAAGIETLRAYLDTAPKGPTAAEAARYVENPRRAREDFAPDFHFVSLDGERVDLESLRGRVVVLDFWASWCGPCQETVRHLRGLEKRYANQPVTIIGVSLDDDEREWRAAIADGKMTWTQTLDSSGELRRLFGIRPIPTAIVIDGEGIVRGRIFGYSPSYGGTLDSNVRDALKRLAAPPAR